VLSFELDERELLTGHRFDDQAHSKVEHQGGVGCLGSDRAQRPDDLAGPDDLLSL
jgi:hypothetical protein